MLWLIVVGVLLVAVSAALLVALRINRQRSADLPLDVYRLLVAWRAAQCKADIRAASVQVRRELWAALDDIDQRERSQR